MLEFFKLLSESWPIAFTIIGLAGIITIRLSFKDSIRKEENRLRGENSVIVYSKNGKPNESSH